ncbi:MAG: radical SAM protein [Pseudothermotoga sp.]
MKTFQEIEKLIQMGYRSFLISGGLDLRGKIPYDSEILDKLFHLKESYNLKYNFHIGFPSEPINELRGLADVVSFDFFSDTELFEKIYGLRRTVDHLLLDAIISSKIYAVPHITIGIDCGKLTHESESLRILSEYFSSVVLNVFIPTPSTRYENCSPPIIDEVKKVFEQAKKTFKMVVLGCMQPKGIYRFHLQKALEDFVDVIVKPVTVRREDFEGCCAFLLERLSQGVLSDVRQRILEETR